MPISLVGLNPYLANIIIDGTIERNVREALVAETLYRRDVMPQVFEGRIGETKQIARSGLLPVSLAPLTPGTDPTPVQYTRETYLSEPDRYLGTVDAYMPNDYVAVMKESMEKSSRLAINSGQTVDRLARQSLYRAYLAGNTVTTVIAAIGAAQVHVASLNGFTVVNSATTGIPVTVSAANPLAVSFAGAEPDNTVVGFTPDDPAAPFGPGWLTLGAVLTAGVAARGAVLAANRSQLIIAGGGNSVDLIGAADTLSYGDLVNAVAALRQGPASVPTFSDGMYHCHLPVAGEQQLLLDPVIRGLLGSDRIPEEWRNAAIGDLAGSMLIRNPSSPDRFNSGTLVSSGAGASFTSPEIGGEVINNAGINIAYTIVYGQGHLYEDYIPPTAMTPDQEISQQGQMPPAQSSGVNINVDRISYIIRPPIDRADEVTAMTWKYYGNFPAPSDITTQDRRYRRAVVIAHAAP